MNPTLFVGMISDFTGALDDDVVVVPVDTVEPLPEASTVVLLMDAFAGLPQHLVGQRKIDLSRALQRGATLVLLCGQGFHAGYVSEIIGWLRSKLELVLDARGELEVRAVESSLSRYFQDQLAYAVVPVTHAPDLTRRTLAMAVGPTGDLVGSAAQTWEHGRSRVVILPIRATYGDAAIQSVLDCLAFLRGADEFPAYLDELVLGDETQLRAELESLATRRAEIEGLLEDARIAKRILYVSEKPLETEVVRFLNEELGVPARHVGGSDEDFWLTDSDSRDWCIGEVGSFASGSLDRQKVGRLDDHRKQAGKPDDFPALLVANTVYRRQTVAERDEAIAPNVRARAAADHILVVRTLDLFRLKQLELQGGSATNQFVEAVRATGGWFEVDADHEVRVHSS